MFEQKDKEMAKNYAIGRTYPKFETNYIANFVLREVEGAFLAGLKAGRPNWHKLDWEKDYPELDRLVRVRTEYKEEYICKTFAYYSSEDEIGYRHILTQFERLNGDWLDDNEIEYWCYIEPFKE